MWNEMRCFIDLIETNKIRRILLKISIRFEQLKSAHNLFVLKTNRMRWFGIAYAGGYSKNSVPTACPTFWLRLEKWYLKLRHPIKLAPIRISRGIDHVTWESWSHYYLLLLFCYSSFVAQKSRHANRFFFFFNHSTKRKCQKWHNLLYCLVCYLWHVLFTVELKNGTIGRQREKEKKNNARSQGVCGHLMARSFLYIYLRFNCCCSHFSFSPAAHFTV